MLDAVLVEKMSQALSAFYPYNFEQASKHYHTLMGLVARTDAL